LDECVRPFENPLAEPSRWSGCALYDALATTPGEL